MSLCKERELWSLVNCHVFWFVFDRSSLAFLWTSLFFSTPFSSSIHIFQCLFFLTSEARSNAVLYRCCWRHGLTVAPVFWINLQKISIMTNVFWDSWPADSQTRRPADLFPTLFMIMLIFSVKKIMVLLAFYRIGSLQASEKNTSLLSISQDKVMYMYFLIKKSY